MKPEVKKAEIPVLVKKVEKESRIDLDKVKTLDDLLAMDPQKLKQELKTLGLKCGGSPKQRAERLFAIKKDLSVFHHAVVWNVSVWVWAT